MSQGTGESGKDAGGLGQSGWGAAKAPWVGGIKSACSMGTAAPGWTSHVSSESNSWLSFSTQVMSDQWLPGAGWKVQY